MKIEIEWLEKLIKTKEKETCVDKVLSLSSSSANGKLENFLSDIQRVVVDVALLNGDRNKRHFIVKTLPKTVDHKRFVTEKNLFVKEIKMYDRILSCMSRRMEGSGDFKERLWCEMVGFEPYHTIILEDLRMSGFQTINAKTTMLDRQTTLLVVASLARYHALTVVAEKDGVFEPAEFKDYMFASESYSRRQSAYLMRTVAESIDTYWGPEWKDIALRIKKLSENTKRIVNLKGGYNKLNVLNHGDFWSGNILVKFDRNKNPVAIKIVDFQMNHYDSFAWDLNHVLYCSVDPEARRKYFEEFLEAYLNSLNQHLQLYGVELASPLTIEDVHQEMNRLRLFAFYLQFFCMAVVTCELDDVVVLDEWCAPEGRQAGGLSPKIYACEKFRKLVELDLVQFAAEGTI